MDEGIKIQNKCPRSPGRKDPRKKGPIGEREPSRNWQISQNYHKQCKHWAQGWHWEDFPEDFFSPPNVCCHFFFVFNEEALDQFWGWLALSFVPLHNETWPLFSFSSNRFVFWVFWLFFFLLLETAPGSPHKHWLLCCWSRGLQETTVMDKADGAELCSNRVWVDMTIRG